MGLGITMFGVLKWLDALFVEESLMDNLFQDMEIQVL